MALPTQLELAYVAGYMDADGSFMISQINGGHRVEVQCSSVHPEILESMQDHWGGHLHTGPNYGENAKDITQWRVIGHHAVKFIEDISQYLGLKKGRAATCVEWFKAKNPVLIKRLKVANKRGKNGRPPAHSSTA